MKRILAWLFFVLFLCGQSQAQTESISQILNFPAVGNWNGFLGHLNVLECSNFNQQVVQFDLSVRSNSGDEIGTRAVTIPARDTVHIILNDFDITDAFGTFQLSLVAGSENLGNRISCNTIIYRNGSDRMEYAFALPVRNSLTGTTGGLFNSIDPEATSQPTFNWLSLVNTGASDFTGTLILYSQNGTELESIAVTALSPGERSDFPLGHEDGQVVGLYRVVPDDATAPYQAFLTRYAARGTGFAFAFPLHAYSGSCNMQQLSLSTFGPANNWVEVANMTGAESTVTLEVLDVNGNITDTQDITLAAYSQHHVFANAIIGENNIASVRVRCQNPLFDNILLQSIFYGRYPDSSSLRFAYGVQAGGIFADAQVALALPVNTFLGATNWLKQFNSSANNFSGTLEVDSPLFAPETSEINLNPATTQDTLLNGAPFAADDIGFATVSSNDLGSRFRAEIIRVFTDETGAIDNILHIPAAVISNPTVGLEETIPASLGIAVPVHVTNAGDGSDRLFVIEKGGLVKVFTGGTILPTPFLDISALLPADSPTTEHGVQNLVFHPDYATNGRFYIIYNDVNGDGVLAEYTVSADPNVANPASARIVLTYLHPNMETIHNGGGLGFGPDSYLYWSIGDTGPQEDVDGNAQNLMNLSGTIIRIDVDSATPYAIPADNPFVGDPNALDEIWAYGFRNPWRFDFDPMSGRMIIADVGQVTVEEIDIGTPGGNFGWNIKEGSNCFNPSINCDDSDLIEPIHDYGRDEGGSVIGGFVYRGSAIPEIQGAYIFGDFNSRKIWILKETLDGSWERHLLFETTMLVTSFGMDEAGEPYVVDIFGGIHKIIPGQ